LDCPNEAAENGRDELVLVTGLKTESDPPPLGVNMNCGCIEVDRVDGRWGPYDAPPCWPRMSMPLRSKYIWSSFMGCGVETAEGNAELGGE
jgi:hypothetical protein